MCLSLLWVVGVVHVKSFVFSHVMRGLCLRRTLQQCYKLDQRSIRSVFLLPKLSRPVLFLPVVSRSLSERKLPDRPSKMTKASVSVGVSAAKGRTASRLLDG